MGFNSAVKGLNYGGGRTLSYYVYKAPTPEAARSKACVCGRSLAGIKGSNPVGGMNVCFL